MAANVAGTDALDAQRYTNNKNQHPHFKLPHLNGQPQLTCIRYLRDLIEVLVVWDAQGSHAILMSPFFEVALKCAPSPVAHATTDLALELLRGGDKLSS